MYMNKIKNPNLLLAWICTDSVFWKKGLDMKGVWMCLAIQEMRKESEMEGAVETYKEIGFSLAETIKRIVERFQLSESEASETVKLYW